MQSSSIFPEEIIVDILSRLPAKSIGRCRCVSKPWRIFLSKPQFIKIHIDRIRKLQEQSLILVGESGCIYSVTLNNAHHVFDEITEPVRKLSFAGHPDSWDKFLTSCDGLVLIGNKKCKIFLVNPITREIRKVPRSPFALDPCASFTMYGLGYDSVIDDYKIVTLSYYDTDNEHEPDCTEMFVNVYSVKNGSWKKAESSPYDHAVGHFSPGVFVHGCIHWLASKTTDSSVIAAFDLAKEKFCEVPPPSSIRNFVFNRLAVLGGCLCMFSTSFSDGTDVWIMKEYGNKESWSKFTITDTEGAEFRPLCMLGPQQVVLVKDEEAADEKLVKYNLEKGTFKDIVVHGDSDDFVAEGTFIKCFFLLDGPQFAEGTFIESLVSPHCSNETS